MGQLDMFTRKRFQFILRSFVETADRNYILARWAALNGLHVDFFWMGVHAVEKYLKAILLFNGGNANTQSHDIEKLSDDVLSLIPTLSWSELKEPSPHMEDWREERMQSYIRRLNNRGDPSNRYLAYGIYFVPDDLYRLDQLVWTVRRHSRPLRPPHKPEVDWVDTLRRDPTEWRLGLLPLERALDAKAGRAQLEAARTLNQPFAPSDDHDFSSSGFGFAMASGTLGDWFSDLTNESIPTEKRELAAQLLRWALDNVGMSSADKRHVNAAIAKFGKPIAHPG